MNLTDQIIKQADLINDLEEILNLNIDDEAVQYGTKVLRTLEGLKSDSILDKNAINDIIVKVRSIMTSIQDTQEELYVLQQRLIGEKKLDV